MFIEGLHTLLALSVPHPDCFIITTRHDQSTVLTELCTPHPVAMATQSELKLLSAYCPNLRGEERRGKNERGGGGVRGRRGRERGGEKEAGGRKE